MTEARLVLLDEAAEAVASVAAPWPCTRVDFEPSMPRDTRIAGCVVQRPGEPDLRIALLQPLTIAAGQYARLVIAIEAIP